MNIQKMKYMQEFDIMPCGISIFQANNECTIEYANPAFYEAIGYSESEVRYKLGNRLSALLDKKSCREIDDFITKRDTEGYLSIEICIKSSPDQEVWFWAQISRISPENKELLLLQSHEITQYKRAENEYTKMCEKRAYLNRHTGFEIIEFDLETGCILESDSNMFRQNGMDEGDIFPDGVMEKGILEAENLERVQDGIRRLKKGEQRVVCEIKMATAGGAFRWSVLSMGVQKYGKHVTVIAIFTDVSAEKEAVQNYLNEALFYQQIMSAQDAYGHLDVTEDQFIRVGGMWKVYQERIDEVGFTDITREFINRIVHEDDKKRYFEMMNVDIFKESYRSGITKLGCEFRRIVELNKMMWMSITVLLFEHPITKHLMGLLYLRNIDTQKRQKLILEYEAGYDALTSLYSKRTFFALAKECVGQMCEGEAAALVIIDLDDFRILNEKKGYEFGDKVLAYMADTLRQFFRKVDIVGRFEGDEFVIFIRDIETLEEIDDRLKELMERIRQEELSVTVSMGVAFMHQLEDLDETAAKAAAALLEAKHAGKDRYCVYQKDSHLENVAECYKQLRTKEKILGYGIEEERRQGETFNLREQNEFHEFTGHYGEMAYLIHPKTYELVCANQAFYDRIGNTEAECRGRKCYEIIHKRDLPCPFCGKNNWTDDKFYMYRNYNEALEQEFLVKNKLVQWGRKKYLFAIAVDLSNDKNILESLENETTENQMILNGILHMQNADSLDKALVCALESVGGFFRSSNARFWIQDEETKQYICRQQWYQYKEEAMGAETQEVVEAVSTWLLNRRWDERFGADNQEMMLFTSYEMYARMKAHNFFNQHWIVLRNDYEKVLGFIEINNITINMQNISFMRSFCGFITNEWRKRKMVEDIIHNSYYDKLTGALNHTSYEEHLKGCRVEEFDSVGVISINMDGLKKINEHFGLQYGNDCIRELGGLLQREFGENTVFRLSGDEFLVIEKDTSQKGLEAGIAAVERQLKKWGSFAVSMGYAWDNIEKNLEELVEYANQVMRLNKKRHHDAVNAEKDQIGMLGGLVTAIEQGHMVVYLQPKIDTRTGKTMGAEALVRYQDEENGVVSPGKFIPILEQCNLIRYVDLFVFEEVCKMLERWKKDGMQCPVVSLNFSRLTLVENDLISSVESIYEKYDVEKKYIEIEITESYADVGKALLNQAARKIRAAGFPISLDDFGTKYTNLTILTDIEVNVLKLDRSLVCALKENEKNKTILKNIIRMCEELEIEVIAEGVELKEQEDILIQLGCHLIQGYLYSKPIERRLFEEQFLLPVKP